MIQQVAYKVAGDLVLGSLPSLISFHSIFIFAQVKRSIFWFSKCCVRCVPGQSQGGPP